MCAARGALDPESTLGCALDAGARTTDHQPNTVKPVPTKKHIPGATRSEARPGASADRGDDLATRGVADGAPWPNVWTWHAPGEGRDAAIDVAMRTEWLLTNGLGGFAMGSVPDVPTRRYHGLLIAAASPPVGRTLALHSLVATLHVEHGGRRASFDLSTFEFARHADPSHEPDDTLLHPRGVAHLARVDVLSCPGGAGPDDAPAQRRVRWVYRCEAPGLGAPVEVVKTLELIAGENAARVGYEVRGGNTGAACRLVVRPLAAMNDMHELQRRGAMEDLRAWAQDGGDEKSVGVTLERGGWALRLIAPARTPAGAAAWRDDEQWWYNLHLRAERERHQDFRRDLFSPGEWEVVAARGASGPNENGGGGMGVTIEARFEGAGAAVARARAGGASIAPSIPGAGAGARAGAGGRSRLDAARTEPGMARWANLLDAAADAFVVRRQERAAGTGEVGDGGEGVSIIAGYPWFSDWGRDALISLPGLLLCKGRFDEARRLLETFARAARRGVVPNYFGDQTGAPSYNTVDASLWFIHAACSLRETGGPGAVSPVILDACLSIVEHYRTGTSAGESDPHAPASPIAMDPRDYLIAAGDASSQLTWMDARRDGVTFTPRSGKPVEVNALWVSGLWRLAETLEAARGARGAVEGPSPADLRDLARASGDSFARLYWDESLGCLFDRLEPAGAARAGDAGGGRRESAWVGVSEVRPNQLIALALPHCPVPAERRRRALSVCRERLWTPRGVRTLDPHDRRYRGRYEGSLFDRDAAYHQGTAWPWLSGVFALAELRTGDFSPAARRSAVEAIAPLLSELDTTSELGSCPGFIAEVYDGSGLGDPHDPRNTTGQRPGGCPAQAWSIGVLIEALCAAACD